jgi:Flp pilus assembly protein TadB
MNIAALMLAAAGIACAAWVIITSRGDAAQTAAKRTSDADWTSAAANSEGFERSLINAGRRFAGVGDVVDTSGRLGRIVEAKLLAAGGRYGANKDIFFAAQTVAVVAGSIVIAIVGLGILPLYMGLAGPLIACLPYADLSSKAKKRSAEINAALPEFADLLSMPLSVGRPVLSALAITAERTSGIVSEEVTNMLTLINTHSVTETEAFALAGERLGTSEARAFFNVLSQGTTSGAKVLENIESQAEALRTSWFQERRGQIKLIGVRMIVIFGIHFIPVLLMFGLLPVAVAFMDM